MGEREELRREFIDGLDRDALSGSLRDQFSPRGKFFGRATLLPRGNKIRASRAGGPLINRYLY
jgi:hypothetical protein